MADITLHSVSFNLDVAADVSIDWSASQSYSETQNQHPWQARLVVDGTNNCARGGARVTDTPNLMGACGQLAPGTHSVQVIWYADSAITISGSVLRILITKR